MKVLNIIRSSTVRQETESQKAELIDFCNSLGFQTSDLIFIEVAGASARKCNKLYLDMLDRIKSTILSNPEIKSVALWHLNRLGRVESKLHEMKEFFVSNHIQVYVKEPNITLLDENGNLSAGGSIAFSVYASMVQYETAEMFAKMKRGKERNKAAGLFLGGYLKFGYQLTDNKTIIVYPDEAKIVRLIFELYSTGKYNITDLADEMNSRGYIKDGHSFNYDMIAKILRDDSYSGYQTNTNRKWPEIISPELYQKCKTIKENRLISHVPTREFTKVNLAVGIYKCKLCGANYICDGDYYICYGKKKIGSSVKCTSINTRVDYIDSLLILVSKYAILGQLINKQDDDTDNLESELSIIDKKLSVLVSNKEKLEIRKNKLQDDYYCDGTMSESAYNKRLSSINDKLSGFNNQTTLLLSEKERIQSLINNRNIGDPYEKIYLSMWDLNWNETGRENRLRIKRFITDNILKVESYPVEESGTNMKSIIIEIYDRYNHILKFKFNRYIDNFKDKVSALSYYMSDTVIEPVYLTSNDFFFKGSQILNPKVENAIRMIYGVPEADYLKFKNVLDKYIKKNDPNS